MAIFSASACCGPVITLTSYIFCVFYFTVSAEADLCMFSMFGRTGAPTKMGPSHEDQKKFQSMPDSS